MPLEKPRSAAGTVETEAVRIGVRGRVAVGRGQHDGHYRAAFEPLAIDGDLLAREPDRQLDRES